MNQVKGEPLISDLGYGRFEAGHLWADPKNDQASAFYLDANFEKAFKIDDISSVFHYELTNDVGVLDSFVTGDENGDLRFEKFNGVLNEDEIANLPTVSLMEASEDCFLDVDFSKKVPELDYRFCEELSLKQTSSTISEGNMTSNSFIQSEDNACSLLAATKISCTSTCLQDDRLIHVSEGLETEGISTVDLCADSSSEDNIASARQRRLCKPPRRYMEGSLLFRSRLDEAMKSPGSTMKGKDLGVLSQRKHRRKRKVPKALKNYSIWDVDSDDEYEPSSSKLWGRKSGRKGRGKKMNVWTVDEVVLLVDGLAQFGVGQWTAVQRACFNSSRRSATDIRDKWRNLVKYSCKNPKRKRKDDRQQQRNCSHPLPTYVIERVRELATSQPVRSNKS